MYFLKIDNVFLEFENVYFWSSLQQGDAHGVMGNEESRTEKQSFNWKPAHSPGKWLKIGSATSSSSYFSMF